MHTEPSRRERIVFTAGRLFAQHGFEATSMRDIAAALGVKGGSLYTHISGKDELLEEVVMHAALEFEGALVPLSGGQEAAGVRLRAALEAHLKVLERNLEFATVFFNEYRHLPPAKLEKVLEKRGAVEGAYRRIFEAGVQSGEFAADLDTRMAAVLALSAVNWAYQWFNPSGRLSAAEVAQRFAAMILGGVQAR